MTTIKKIAELAETSVATVSRVINDSGYVSATLRARIQRVMREAHYQPGAIAKGLRSGESRLVGVLLPSLDVEFFGILAHAIEQALFSQGYAAFICSTSENQAHEERYVNMLLSHRVDGVIVASAHGTGQHIARLAAQRTPVVAIDRALPEIAHTTISVDHEDGGRRMVEHLLSLGHQAIGVVGAPAHSEPIAARLAGIRSGLAHAGLKLPARWCSIGTEHRIEACYGLARKVLGTAPPPTALIGLSDLAAIAALHAARDAQLAVPAQLSVIGFDDIPLAAHVVPGLTTIAQPIRAIGERAVERLLQCIADKQVHLPPMELMPLKLVVRGSTQAPAR